MNTALKLLQAHPQVSDYKINVHQKESCELFYVKGRLETVRCTDTCDKEVTVYVEHDNCKGDAQFFLYPSTDPGQIPQLIDEAVAKALLIHNQNYELPGAEQGEYTVESNFSDYAPADLAAEIAQTVFAANTVENAALNSVEVFVTRHVRSVQNSHGLCKRQVSYDAMVECIPTYNGETQSVELYQQYNFAVMDSRSLSRRIAEKIAQVKARYEAVKPDAPIDCPVILGKEELGSLFSELARDLNYAAVYSHANLFKKGDLIQKDPQGDRISVSMAGEAPGCVRSAKFDADGMSLRSIRIIEDGKAVNYHGSNRYGQYLGETPTGVLRCLLVDAGTASPEEFARGPFLEVVSMSGLQVDLNNDYIGGEIRLAYYHDGSRLIPVTGISMSGSLSDVLRCIRLSSEIGMEDGYIGPEKALLQNMKIY